MKYRGNLKNKKHMRTLTIQIPDTVEVEDREMIMYFASRMYEKGKLSLGQAVKPVLASIKATNFRISEGLEKKILMLAGE